MAKLLGQEIVTHDEFKNFLEDDVKKLKHTCADYQCAVIDAQAQMSDLKSRFLAVMVVSATAIVVSIGTLLFAFLH
jgi:hypothetical protein